MPSTPATAKPVVASLFTTCACAAALQRSHGCCRRHIAAKRHPAEAANAGGRGATPAAHRSPSRCRRTRARPRGSACARHCQGQHLHHDRACAHTKYALINAVKPDLDTTRTALHCTALHCTALHAHTHFGTHARTHRYHCNSGRPLSACRSSRPEPRAPRTLHRSASQRIGWIHCHHIHPIAAIGHNSAAAVNGVALHRTVRAQICSYL